MDSSRISRIFQISPKSLKQLIPFLPHTQVQRLDLGGNSIGDIEVQGLAALLPKTQITQLDLGSNKIGDTGAKVLATVLPQTKITELDLRSNVIGDIGAKALVDILPLTKLSRLLLQGNQINEAQKRALADVLPQNQAFLRQGSELLTKDNGKLALLCDFKTITSQGEPDLKQQKLMLQGLHDWLFYTNHQLEEVRLLNCDVLTAQDLLPILKIRIGPT